MRFWLSFVAMVVSAGIADAQTWTQTATPAAWNLDGNWSVPPFPNVIDAAAVFNTPIVAQTANLTQAITVGSINFTNNAALIQTLANGGGTLTFDVTTGNASIIVNGTSATTNNVTISATTTLNDTLQFTNNNVAGTGTATATMTGAVTGGGGFIKDGPGRFSFSTVAKAYTGATQINQGRFRMTLTGSVTGTSSISVASGGSLFLDQASGAWALGAGMALITINGDGDNGGGTNTQGALRNQGSGASTLANPVTLGSNATIHVEIATASLQLNGGLSGNSVLTKSGFGNLILPTTNAGLTGGTTITNGTITVNAGSNIGTGNLTMSQVAGANATLTLNNAAQSVGDLSSAFTDVAGTFAHTINLNGTALTINQMSNTTYGTGAVPTLTSTIAGTGNVTMANTSTGILNLTGGNTHTGGFFILGGTVLANNTAGSALGITGFVLVNGGTLGGSGIISPSVSVIAGKFAPGNSTGILTLNTHFTMNGGTFEAELQGLTAGTQYDQLALTSGNIQLLGASSLSLLISGYTPTLSDVFVIINNTGPGTLTGTFAGLPDQSIVASNVLGSGIDYLIYYGTYSGFPTSVVIAPVPEPATVLALCAAGAGAVGLVRRRLKKGKTTELAA